MPKKKIPKLPKKRTPNQEVNKAKKVSNQRRKGTQYEYGDDAALNRLKERGKSEDVNQAAARIVREATQD